MTADAIFILLFKYVVGLLFLSGALLSGARAWRSTARTGRRFVVALLALGTVTVVMGLVMQSRDLIMPVINPWTLIALGGAAYVAVGCWIVWKALAAESSLPGLEAGPESLEKLDRAAIRFTSVIRNGGGSDDDD